VSSTRRKGFPEGTGAWCAGGILCAALLGMRDAGAAEGAPVADGAVKMAIVYNLGKFVDWPANAFPSATAPFTLCVLGSPNRIQDGLDAIESKAVHGRGLKVRLVKGPGEFAGCQILFLADADSRRLEDHLAAAHSQGVLTVSDMDHFTDDGGAVALLLMDNRVRFAINLNATQAANLRISSELLRLAQRVVGAQKP